MHVPQHNHWSYITHTAHYTGYRHADTGDHRCTEYCGTVGLFCAQQTERLNIGTLVCGGPVPFPDTPHLPCDDINEHVNSLQIRREGGPPCGIYLSKCHSQVVCDVLQFLLHHRCQGDAWCDRLVDYLVQL